MGRETAFDINSRLVTCAHWVKGAQALKAIGVSSELRLQMVGGSQYPGGLEQLLRQSAELAPGEGGGEEAFWVLGAGDHRLIYASPAYARLSGHSQARLHADPGRWLDAIHPEDRGRVLTSLSASVDIGAYEESYRRLTSSGEVQWVEDRGFLVRDRNSEQTMIAGMTRLIPPRAVAPARQVR
jgi:PAS domain S-box-containing protein